MKSKLIYLITILVSIIGLYCDVSSLFLVEMTNNSRIIFVLLFLVVFGGTIVWSIVNLKRNSDIISETT